jgi:hypothetical protein
MHASPKRLLEFSGFCPLRGPNAARERDSPIPVVPQLLVSSRTLQDQPLHQQTSFRTFVYRVEANETSLAISNEEVFRFNLQCLYAHIRGVHVQGIAYADSRLSLLVAALECPCNILRRLFSHRP